MTVPSLYYKNIFKYITEPQKVNPDLHYPCYHDDDLHYKLQKPECSATSAAAVPSVAEETWAAAEAQTVHQGATSQRR